VSEEVRRTLRYVEPLSEARTPLADFFSILLGLYKLGRLPNMDVFRFEPSWHSGRDAYRNTRITPVRGELRNDTPEFYGWFKRPWLNTALPSDRYCGGEQHGAAHENSLCWFE